MQLILAVSSINDRSSSRTINIIIAALAGLGALMLAITLWVWKTSRPVPPHLEGLDLITKRRWLRSDHGQREQILEPLREARGSVPVSVARDPEAIVAGPAMPISVDAVSTSLGVASAPGVSVVSAPAGSGDGWPDSPRTVLPYVGLAAVAGAANAAEPAHTASADTGLTFNSGDHAGSAAADAADAEGWPVAASRSVSDRGAGSGPDVLDADGWPVAPSEAIGTASVNGWPETWPGEFEPESSPGGWLHPTKPNDAPIHTESLSIEPAFPPVEPNSAAAESSYGDANG